MASQESSPRHLQSLPFWLLLGCPGGLLGAQNKPPKVGGCWGEIRAKVVSNRPPEGAPEPLPGPGRPGPARPGPAGAGQARQALPRAPGRASSQSPGHLQGLCPNHLLTSARVGGLRRNARNVNNCFGMPSRCPQQPMPSAVAVVGRRHWLRKSTVVLCKPSRLLLAASQSPCLIFLSSAFGQQPPPRLFGVEKRNTASSGTAEAENGTSKNHQRVLKTTSHFP